MEHFTFEKMMKLVELCLESPSRPASARHRRRRWSGAVTEGRCHAPAGNVGGRATPGPEAGVRAPSPAAQGVPLRRRGVGCVGSGKDFTATITTPVMKGLHRGNSERRLSDEADVHQVVSITLFMIPVLPSLTTKTTFPKIR